MLVSDFRTTDMPVGDRFECWIEHVGRALAPVGGQAKDRENFQGRIRVIALGAVTLVTAAHPALSVRRSGQMIRRHDPEAYQVALIRNGDGLVMKGRQEMAFGSGDLVLVDTSHPFEALRSAKSDRTSSIVVQVPRALLPLSPRAAGSFPWGTLPTRGGIGRVFAHWLMNIDRYSGELTADSARALESVTIELLTAVMSCRFDTVGSMSHESGLYILRSQIRDYVEQRLGDPELSPATIAVAHQVSVRRLYQIFEDEEFTLTAWIRRRRLENCYRDLADPRLLSRPVHAVARRWGFLDAAHFSRTFRAVYGMPPSVHRRLAVHGDPHAGIDKQGSPVVNDFHVGLSHP
ncbi:helix-turn-helix domain-containing protein [Herbidospora sp. NEAU-GS84]|uniref:Helix-turn-helix domain-containing protein n=1 Tax=Herbidospora solisilvae TaxID=2696284 RepID=A0A7C9NH16_9ACTN|nr:helix-turn-helix domain-containing protein [Herbidospora solisilvae]NAS22818.1 helix-turn-helix domain-containing protein [Herbidospora solisilvae]